MDAADRKHVNSSWADTVKCLLDASKSPLFRSQSPCTDISVRKSQRVTIFVRIYPYESLKGLRSRDCIFYLIMCVCMHICQLLTSFTFGQLLRSAHKCITKVYIERNDMQVELIRFSKISTLFTFTFRGTLCLQHIR